MKAKLLIFSSLVPILFLSGLPKSIAQTIGTYAGNYPNIGYFHDGYGATSAYLNSPEGLALDPITQDLYIADKNNNVIRKVDRHTNIITTVAGNGSSGNSGDGGIATAAKLHSPVGIAVDVSGNLYIADANNFCIRLVDSRGTITTFAGQNGSSGSATDGVSATATKFKRPNGVAIDVAGNVYVTDYDDNSLWMVDNTSSHIITKIASGPIGYNIHGLAIDQQHSNTLYFSATDNTIIKIPGSAGAGATSYYSWTTTDIFAGFSGLQGYSPTLTIPSSTLLWNPSGIAIDNSASGSGNVYFADNGNERIREYNSISGTLNYNLIFTVGGDGSAGYAGNCSSATTSEVNLTTGSGYDVSGIVIDKDGNVFFSDRSNNVVRMITSITAASITGSNTVCQFSTTMLTGTPPGGTWSSSTSSVTVGANGDVSTTGSSGSAVITYAPSCTLVSSTSATVTVNPTSISAISGSSNLCIGEITTLTESSPSSGTWTSLRPTVASVAVSGTHGVLTGITPGATTITFTDPSSTCYTTKSITVNNSRSLSISGSQHWLCDPFYSYTSFASLSLNAVSAGTWSSSATSVATVDPTTGVVTGISGGEAVISFSYSSGCSAVPTEYATFSVTVDPVATSLVVSDDNLCIGQNFSGTEVAGGIYWDYNPLSGTTGILTINPVTGHGQAIDPGNFEIILDGCFRTSDHISTPITVNPLPAPITAPTTVNVICVGEQLSLECSSTGGTWSSGDSYYATVDGSGVVTGHNNGSAIISYSLTGCATTISVSVNGSLPSIGSDPTVICLGSVTTLNPTTAGGSWSSSNTDVATIDITTGVLSAISAGNTTISYSTTYNTCTDVSGTFTAPVVVSIPVDVVPGVTAITGFGTNAHILCRYDNIELSANSDIGDASYYIYSWSSSDVAVAVVSSAGSVTAAGLGTATISFSATYSDGTVSCATPAVATTTLTVNTLPSPIEGSSTVCAGASITINSVPSDPDPGCVWSTSSTVNAAVTATTTENFAVVTGIAVGTAVITYGYSNSRCFQPFFLTINPIPADIGITGAGGVCLNSSITLSEATGGGTWSSSNTTEGTPLQ